MRLVITFLNLGVNIKGFISGEDVALLIEILADSQSMSSFFSCIIGMIANRDISELQVLGRKSLAIITMIGDNMLYNISALGI